MPNFGTTPTSTTPLGLNQFPVSAARIPNFDNLGSLIAVEGIAVNTDTYGFQTTAFRIGLKDGDDATQGLTTDAAVTGDVAGTISAKLRGLSKIFAQLQFDGSNNLKVTVASGSIAATQSGAWNITNITGTVSLPIGASTDATLSKLTITPGTALGSNTGAMVQGSVSTNAPSYVTGNINPLSLDTSGLLRVSWKDSPSNSNNFNINIAASGVTLTTNSTVSQATGTNLHTVVDSGSIVVTQATGSSLHAVIDSGSINVTTNAEASLGATTAPNKGILVLGKTNDGTPQYQPLSMGAGGRSVIVEGFTGGTAVPVSQSGAWSVNAGTNLNTSLLALDTSVNGILIGQGTALAGLKGPMAQASVTTNAPSYTTGQVSPLSIDTSGLLRVSLKDTASNSNNLNVNIAASGISLTVAQTTASNLNAQVVGAVASGGSNAGNPVKIAGVFNTTQPTVTNAQIVDIQTTARGAQIVAPGVDGFAVTQSGSNWSSNVAQVAGTAADVNTGNASAGTLRVVLASNQPAVAVSQSGAWSITANAGTNLNTSLLALDTSVNGILLAQGSSTASQKGPLSQAAVTTNAPSYTTGQTSPLSLDLSGLLRVSLKDTPSNSNNLNVALAASSATVTVTASNLQINLNQIAGSAIATAATGIIKVGVTDGSGNAITSTSNALDVNIKSGSTTYNVVDEATWTAGTSTFIPAGGVFNDSAAALTSGQQGTVRVTNNRAIHVNLRDASANQLLGSKTSANSIPVVIASDQGSFSITANIGTTNGLALDTSVNGILLSQGSTTSGQKGPLVQGAVSTNAPSYTTAQTSPLSLDVSGLLRISLKDTPSNSNNLNINLAASAATVTVTATNLQTNLNQIAGAAIATAASGIIKVGLTDASGNALNSTSNALNVSVTNATLAVTQSGTWTIQPGNAQNTTPWLTQDSADGPVSAGSAASKSILGGLVYNTSAPAPTNGQQVAKQGDQAGNLKITPGIATATLSAWNSSTGLNTAQTIFSNSGVPAVAVQLDQTTTITGGAITFEVNYDGSTWVTIPSFDVLDPTSATYAQINLPYTLQASTNKSFLLINSGWQGLRIKLSTVITGTGAITPYYSLLPYNPAATVFALSPTAANFNVTVGASSNVIGSVMIQAVSGTALSADQSNSILKTSLYVKKTTNADTVLTLGSTTSANSIPVVIASDQGAFPVSQSGSWSVTANVGTTNGLALDATVAKLNVAQGTALGSNTGPMIQASVTTNAPSYTTGNINPLSLDTSGLLRISIKDTPSNSNNFNVNIAASAATVTVTATNLQSNLNQIGGNAVVTGGANGLLAVAGPVASGSANADNPLKMGGAFNTTQPTVTNSQIVDAQMTARGAQIVSTGVDTFNVTVNAALPTGANTIGAVTQASGPWTNNLTQIGSTNVITGGASGLLAVGGPVASGSSNADNPLKIGAVFNTTQPTVTNAQIVDIQASARGALIVTTGVDTFNTTINAALPAGGNTIGSVTQASGPWTNNVTQFGSNNVATGTGASGSGIPRVTVSNDSQIQLWDGTTGPVAVKAANTSPVLADKAMVHTLSPNNSGLPVNLPFIIQKAVAKSSGSVASLALAFGSNNISGNSIVVVCAVGNGTAPTISDTLGNIYTQSPQIANGTALNVAIFYSVGTALGGGIASGANTVTVNNGGTTASIAMEIYEVSGLITQTQAQPDLTATNTGNSGTASTSAISPFTPNVYAFAAIGVGTAAQTITAGSGWINDSGQQNPTTPAGLFSFISMSQFLGSVKAVTPQATFTSEPWAIAVAAFRPVLLGIEGTQKITDGTVTMSFGSKTSANSIPVVIASDQGAVAIGVVSGTALTADQSNTILKTSLYVKKTTNADTVLALGSATSANSIPVVIASDQGAVPVSQSGTWTVQPGNTANTTPWLFSPQVTSSGGSIPYHNLSAASTNSTNVKGAACQMYSYAITNTNASARYVKFYDKATAPTIGTDTPKHTIQIPGSSIVIRTMPEGMKFTTGFGWGTTTGVADTDTGAVGSNDLVVDFNLNS